MSVTLRGNILRTLNIKNTCNVLKLPLLRVEIVKKKRVMGFILRWCSNLYNYSYMNGGQIFIVVFITLPHACVPIVCPVFLPFCLTMPTE